MIFVSQSVYSVQSINYLDVSYNEINSQPMDYNKHNVKFDGTYLGLFPSRSLNFPNEVYYRLYIKTPQVGIPFMRHNIYIMKDIVDNSKDFPKRGDNVKLYGTCHSIFDRGIDNNEHAIVIYNIDKIKHRKVKQTSRSKKIVWDIHKKKKKVGKIVVNGYRVEKDEHGSNKGNVKVSVSAFDKNNKLLKNVKIKDVKFNEVKDENGNYIQARARVKYDIHVTKEPLFAGINLDTTRSMKDNDPKNLRIAAASNFIRKMRDGYDHAMVMHFDTFSKKSSKFLAGEVLQNFCSDKRALINAIGKTRNDGDKFGGGNTPLWDSCYDALMKMSGIDGKEKILIVLTDGDDNFSIRKYFEIIRLAKQNSVKIYMIGLDRNVNQLIMEKVAKDTGGLYKVARNAEELHKLFDDFFNDINASGEVELEFDPPPKPGSNVQGTLNLTIGEKDYPVDFDIKM